MTAEPDDAFVSVGQEKDTVLEEGQKLVYGDRQESYGHPRENMLALAGFIEAYLRAKGWRGPALDAGDGGQLMLLLKIARFATGKRNRDTVVDQGGYVAVTARAIEMDA